MATIGPWMGVPKEKQRVCAIEDCIVTGKNQVCPYDGALHHHGCIHYKDCAKEDAAKLGLKFREGGWAKMCDFHYGLLLDAYEARRREQKVNNAT
jgi:hypothetical protein